VAYHLLSWKKLLKATFSSNISTNLKVEKRNLMKNSSQNQKGKGE
jgi:hypothetical protein